MKGYICLAVILSSIAALADDEVAVCDTKAFKADMGSCLADSSPESCISKLSEHARDNAKCEGTVTAQQLSLVVATTSQCIPGAVMANVALTLRQNVESLCGNPCDNAIERLLALNRELYKDGRIENGTVALQQFRGDMCQRSAKECVFQISYIGNCLIEFFVSQTLKTVDDVMTIALLVQQTKVCFDHYKKESTKKRVSKTASCVMDASVLKNALLATADIALDIGMAVANIVTSNFPCSDVIVEAKSQCGFVDPVRLTKRLAQGMSAVASSILPSGIQELQKRIGGWIDGISKVSKRRLEDEAPMESTHKFAEQLKAINEAFASRQSNEERDAVMKALADLEDDLRGSAIGARHAMTLLQSAIENS